MTVSLYDIERVLNRQRPKGNWPPCLLPKSVEARCKVCFKMMMHERQQQGNSNKTENRKGKRDKGNAQEQERYGCRLLLCSQLDGAVGATWMERRRISDVQVGRFDMTRITMKQR